MSQNSQSGTATFGQSAGAGAGAVMMAPAPGITKTKSGDSKSISSTGGGLPEPGAPVKSSELSRQHSNNTPFVSAARVRQLPPPRSQMNLTSTLSSSSRGDKSAPKAHPALDAQSSDGYRNPRHMLRDFQDVESPNFRNLDQGGPMQIQGGPMQIDVGGDRGTVSNEHAVVVRSVVHHVHVLHEDSRRTGNHHTTTCFSYS